MANNIFEKYGIKEVADVTFYDTATNAPILFLDTLKVSTIEQTAEQVSARGGKGNPELIVWDYGKEITLNLEDALFSPQSMNLMLGGMNGSVLNNDLVNGNTINTLTRMIKYETPNITPTSEVGQDGIPKADTWNIGQTWYNPTTMQKIQNHTDLVAVLKENKYAYCEKTYSDSGVKSGEGKTGSVGNVSGKYIEITAANFPGTYRIVGETYARSQKTGKDEFFQFEIPQAKMGAENTITLEAEGDPSVFNMTMKVLRPESGPMIILRQYDLPDEGITDINAGIIQVATSVNGVSGYIKVQIGSSTTPAPTNIPAGKEFAGWYTDSGITEALTVPTGGWTVDFAAGKKLYAKLEDAT